MQRAGGLEVADAVMVDNTKDRGVLKAGDGLGGLVVVGEDDELTGLDGLDYARLGNAVYLDVAMVARRCRAFADGRATAYFGASMGTKSAPPCTSYLPAARRAT